MPYKPHPCTHPDCPALVKRKSARHCRKHATKTPEHIEKIAAANRGRRLSPEHRRKLSEARRGPDPIDRRCLRCGDWFRAEKPSSKVRFCSRACGYRQRRGEQARNWVSDMPTVGCEVCGTPIRSSARTVRRVTCSYTCKGIRGMLQQKQHPTNIETAMKAALQAAGYRFEEQVPIPRIGIPDFALSGCRVLIFCDGDYWHSKPEHESKDIRVTRKLQAMGYEVFRFKGSEILADVVACIQHLPPPT